MSKDTVASDWTARILRINPHTPSGNAALAIQLSSVTAGAAFEFHLSGAASGPDVPLTKLEIDTDCDKNNTVSPFTAHSIQGANGLAFFDNEKILFLIKDKKGRKVFDGALHSTLPNMGFELRGLYLLKSVTPFKSSASTASDIQTFTNPQKKQLTEDGGRTLN